MKRTTQQIDDLLFDYLDGTLSPKDRADLEIQLHANEQLRSRLETLKIVDITLAGTRLETPSRNFTEKVMAGLYQEKPARSNLSIKNGIWMILGALTVVTILIVLVSSGTFDSTSLIKPDAIGIKDNYFNFKIPSISVNGKLLINSLIILNLAIALIVLDRTILRPFFERRFN